MYELTRSYKPYRSVELINAGNSKVLFIHKHFEILNYTMYVDKRN